MRSLASSKGLKVPVGHLQILGPEVFFTSSDTLPLPAHSPFHPQSSILLTRAQILTNSTHFPSPKMKFSYSILTAIALFPIGLLHSDAAVSSFEGLDSSNLELGNAWVAQAGSTMSNPSDSVIQSAQECAVLADIHTAFSPLVSEVFGSAGITSATPGSHSASLVSSEALTGPLLPSISHEFHLDTVGPVELDLTIDDPNNGNFRFYFTVDRGNDPNAAF